MNLPISVHYFRSPLPPFLKVMYIRAEAALARSESESRTENSAAQGIFTDQRKTASTTVGLVETHGNDYGEKDVIMMKENCSDGPALKSKTLPGDVSLTSPGFGPIMSPRDGPLTSDGDDLITSPPTRAVSARPDMAALRALKRLEDLGLIPGEAEHAAALLAAAEAGSFTSSIAVLRWANVSF